jgi:hypothetical protein
VEQDKPRINLSPHEADDLDAEVATNAMPRFAPAAPLAGQTNVQPRAFTRTAPSWASAAAISRVAPWPNGPAGPPPGSAWQSGGHDQQAGLPGWQAGAGMGAVSAAGVQSDTGIGPMQQGGVQPGAGKAPLPAANAAGLPVGRVSRAAAAALRQQAQQPMGLLQAATAVNDPRRGPQAQPQNEAEAERLRARVEELQNTCVVRRTGIEMCILSSLWWQSRPIIHVGWCRRRAALALLKYGPLP